MCSFTTIRIIFKMNLQSGVVVLILTLRRQRQEDFSEFKVSFIYLLSFRQLDYIVRLSSLTTMQTNAKCKNK